MKAKKGECIADIKHYAFDSEKNCYQVKGSKKPYVITGSIALVLVALLSIVVMSYSKQNLMEHAYYEVMENEEEKESNLYDDDLKLTYNEIKETYYELSNGDQELAPAILTAGVEPVEQRILSTSAKNKEPINKKDAQYSFFSENFKLSDADYESMLRIVEAEATSEDIIGKILVANVVLNRVRVSRFPNTVYDVVHQKGQFSPLSDGRYYSVPITNSTVEAVNRALAGEDYSGGALFFVAKGLASSKAVSWFDENLTQVYKYGVHTFYKY